MENENTKHVKDLIVDFLIQLGLDADIEVSVLDSDQDYKYLKIDLSGENLGEMIGYRGRMLDSMQNILGMVISRDMQKRNIEGEFRVILDVNNYLEQRKNYLESYAKRAAEDVKSSGQPIELDPMKPFERRIVHMVLKTQPGITTESKGDGDDRRVIILPK